MPRTRLRLSPYPGTRTAETGENAAKIIENTSAGKPDAESGNAGRNATTDAMTTTAMAINCDDSCAIADPFRT